MYKAGFIGLLLAAIPMASAAEPLKGSKPNIILILCDDMGFSDSGCYGGEIQTPNLDRMAKEGLRFTQFYNNAKCTTTRASILTGLYPRPGLLTPQMVTTGEVLKQAGYQTALSGKWHLGSRTPRRPIDRGFDEYYGLLDGCCNFFNPAQRDPPYKGNRLRVFAHNEKRITTFPKDYYTTDAFTDHAIATLKRFSKSEKPFFLHLCYTAPHYPLHAKPEDIKKYRGKYLNGWDALRKARHQRQLDMGLLSPKWKLSGKDSRAREWESARKDYEDLRMAVYAAMIDNMDQNIGRLLKALEDSGKQKETLILFLSDNGGCAEEPEGRKCTDPPGPGAHYTSVGPSWGWAQNTPFRRYKSWVHEGGISTPLIAWWPEVIKPNGITAEVGHIIDFMPTFADLAGTTYPKRFNGNEVLPADGLSLLPVLLGKKRQGHKQLAWEWSGNKAVREGKWKLVYDKLTKQWSLFDLEADRTEERDLAEKYPQRVKELMAKYQEWTRHCGKKKKRKQ